MSEVIPFKQYRFKGRNAGPFMKGKIYDIEVELPGPVIRAARAIIELAPRKFRWEVDAFIVVGPNQVAYIPYQTMEAFQANWEDVDGVKFKRVERETRTRATLKRAAA